MSHIDDLIAEMCPQGVRFLSIGETADVGAGATPSKSVVRYWTNGTIPWLNSGEVNKGTIYAADTFITQEGYDSCSTKMIPAGAVVMALAGQGKTRGMVARTRLDCCTNQSLASIIPRDGLDSDFLYHFLKTQYARLRDVSSGDGTRGGLNLAMIRAYRIPVPPLEVQREIVRILDQFTQLEAELEAELEARREQYSFYRDALLTFPEGHRRIPLGEFAELVRGNGMPKTDFVTEGVPAIHYGQIYTHYGTYASQTKSFVSGATAAKLAKVDPGDVVITNTSENIDDVGKAVAWLGADRAVTGGHATVIKHNENPKFLAYYFQTSEFNRIKRKYASGTKVIDVSAKSLAKMSIPLPTREEQDRIVEVLDKFDAIINDQSIGLPAEIAARRKQYEYYRDRLLTFKEAAV